MLFQYYRLYVIWYCNNICISCHMPLLYDESLLKLRFVCAWSKVEVTMVQSDLSL